MSSTWFLNVYLGRFILESQRIISKTLDLHLAYTTIFKFKFPVPSHFWFHSLLIESAPQNAVKLIMQLSIEPLTMIVIVILFVDSDRESIKKGITRKMKTVGTTTSNSSIEVHIWFKHSQASLSQF